MSHEHHSPEAAEGSEDGARIVTSSYADLDVPEPPKGATSLNHPEVDKARDMAEAEAPYQEAASAKKSEVGEYSRQRDMNNDYGRFLDSEDRPNDANDQFQKGIRFDAAAESAKTDAKSLEDGAKMASTEVAAGWKPQEPEHGATSLTDYQVDKARDQAEAEDPFQEAAIDQRQLASFHDKEAQKWEDGSINDHPRFSSDKTYSEHVAAAEESRSDVTKSLDKAGEASDEVASNWKPKIEEEQTTDTPELSELGVEAEAKPDLEAMGKKIEQLEELVTSLKADLERAKNQQNQ